jgi:DNA polymerase-3 subunit alpha
MGKKKKEELDIQFEAFQSGMRDNGYSDDAIQTLWDILVPFSDYAFNKAHSAAYGVVSYWTGYLKAHYPAEYMAALLTSVGDDKDKSAIYLNECRRMNIPVLPPDVNESDVNFAAVDGSIRFGLGAVRNVGHAVVGHIKDARDTKGAFTDFHDFVSKTPAAVLNRRTVESLIKAGAFDQLGNTRRSLAEIHESVVDQAVRQKRAEEHGDVGFDFDSLLAEDDTPATPKIINLPEWSKKELLAQERDMLGLYVSDHPLSGLELGLAEHAEMTVAQLLESELEDGSSITVAGLLTQVNHRVARASGNPYGQLAIEDFSGELQVMCLGKSYTEHQELLQPDSIVSIRGRVQRRDDQVTLHANIIRPLSLQPQESTKWDGPFALQVPEHHATVEVLTELQTALGNHPGDTPVHLRLVTSERARVFQLSAQVEVSANLIAEVKGILGRDCLVVAEKTQPSSVAAR